MNIKAITPNIEVPKALSFPAEGWERTASKIRSIKIRSDYVHLAGVFVLLAYVLVVISIVDKRRNGVWPHNRLGIKIAYFFRKVFTNVQKNLENTYYEHFPKAKFTDGEKQALEDWVNEVSVEQHREFRQGFRDQMLSGSDCLAKYFEGPVSIPPGFEKLTHLKRLYLLSGGQIEIPDSIQYFGNLEKLALEGFTLRENFEAIFNLDKLKELSLYNCGIQQLPESVQNLQSLEDLDLSKNKDLTELPEAIFNLDKLKELRLSNCGIQQLPESVQNFQSLERLDLSRNKDLTELPEAIFNLDKLKELRLSNCGIQQLPESVQNFQSLEKLDLSQNKDLTELPEAIFNLPSTCLVRIRGTGISHLASIIEKVEGADYQGPKFDLLDTEFFTLEEIQGLDEWVNENENEIQNRIHFRDQILSRDSSIFHNFYGDQSVRIPGILSKLTYLQIINIYDGNGVNFPIDLQNFRDLEELILKGFTLQENLEPIFNLDKLKKLSFKNCGIQQLPVSIGNLHSLEKLDLSRNRLLTELPEEIFSLPTSCTIKLNRTGIPVTELERILERANTPGYEGPRFEFSVSDRNTAELSDGGITANLLSVERQLTQWADEFNLETPELREMDELDRGTLNRWLGKLWLTATFNNGLTEVKKAYLTKVFSLLRKSAEDPKFHEAMLLEMADGLGGCGDRITLSFLFIELRYKLLTIDIQNRTHFLQFLRDTYWTVKLIKDIADYKIAQMHASDSVETYLKYFLGLKEPLGMDISLDDMLFPGLSGVAQQDLIRAQGNIIKKRSDNELFAAFLCEQKKEVIDSWLSFGRERWEEALKSYNPEQMEALNDQRYAEIENVFAGNSQVALDVTNGAAANYQSGLISLTKLILT